MKDLNIVSFKKKYKADFEKLNREWIEEFFQMEDEDFYTLQNPESYVIEKNGEIFFAIYDQNVIGTAAMIPFSDGVFELAKMSVIKSFQGRGVGKLLLKIVLVIFVLFVGVIILNKIDFPAPKKEIKKIIPNENFKTIK